MKFDLNQHVNIVGTQLCGLIIGRAEYLRAEPSYFVEFVDAQGLPRVDWFDEVRLMVMTGLV